MGEYAGLVHCDLFVRGWADLLHRQRRSKQKRQVCLFLFGRVGRRNFAAKLLSGIIMSTNTLRKKCPGCKRLRKFTCPEHKLIGNWQKRNNRWTCPWCIARETPDGEQRYREYLKSKKPRGLPEPRSITFCPKPLQMDCSVCLGEKITIANGVPNVKTAGNTGN